MRTVIVILCLLSVVRCAHSANLEQTAVQALRAVTDRDGCVERAGAVIAEPDGSYRATAPEIGEESHFTLRLWLKPGERLAAIYHTHPLCASTKTDTFFSPDDVAAADSLHVPSFIWVAYDNSIREYVPGAALTYNTRLHAQVSLGATLGHYGCDYVPVRLSLAGTVIRREVCTGAS
jgi:hypothetical protein